MRIIFAGTPEVAVPTLLAIAGSSHEVVGVITRKDAPVGRKRVLTPSPVAIAAAKLGLPTLKKNRLDADADAWATGLGADIGVVVAYGGLIREPLLSRPRLGWINLHFSDLPRWRGAAPVQRALMAGEQELGVTVFRLVAELDAGAVVARDDMSFEAGTSAGDALGALANFGTDTVLRALSTLERSPDAGESQQGDSSYAHKLDRADGKLDLSLSAAQVLAHWAGVTPAPGAFVLHDGDPLKLLEVRATQSAGSGPVAAPSPGPDVAPDVPEASARAEIEGGRAVLRLSDGALELARVQPAGKPAMDGVAWLRGRGGEAVLS